MKIAIYSRKSKFTGKGESIENQVILCREYILRNIPEAHDGDITVYEDEGFSAKNLDRPQFRQMMKSAKNHPFDYIVVYRLDRISRNVGDFARLIEELNGMHTAFVCIKEQFDTSTPMGRAMMNIAAVFAQLERETIAERVRDNLVLLARTGRWLGGASPMGFVGERVEIKDGEGRSRSAYKLSTVEDEMRAVREIYRIFAELRSLTGTAAWCVKNGLVTRSGGSFRPRSVRDILTNPVYCTADEAAYEYFTRLGCDVCFEKREADGKHGIMPFRRTSQSGKKSLRLPPEEWLISVGKHVGVIPSEEWIRVQKIISANAGKSFFRPAKSGSAVLAGLVRCGKCGGIMRPRANSGASVLPDGTQVFSYMCEYKERSRRSGCDMCNVSGNALDALVCGGIFDRFGSGAISSEMIMKRVESRRGSSRERAGELERLIAEKKRRIANLMSLLSRGEGTVLSAHTENEICRLDDELRAAESELAELRGGGKTRDESACGSIAERLGDIRGLFAGLSVGDRREFMRRIIYRAEWDGESVHVYFRGA